MRSWSSGHLHESDQLHAVDQGQPGLRGSLGDFEIMIFEEKRAKIIIEEERVKRE